MIPIKDNVVSSTFPVMNYAIIGFTSVIFAIQLVDSDGGDELVERYGMIPARVAEPDRPVEVKKLVPHQGMFGVERILVAKPAAEPPFTPWLTLLTCIFLHGGLMHFLGNMWFLCIFGDNVEDRFGHAGYLLFYLASGVLASLTHLLTNFSSTVPTLGASGAIAGVMGAYFLLYPNAKVLTLVPIFFFFEILVLPAPLFLGLWFLLQFFLGASTITSTETGGVAWWAHIGGFVSGLLVALLLQAADWLRPKATDLRPNTDRITHYRYRFGGDE
jgi:hypothetical protein